MALISYDLIYTRLMYAGRETVSKAYEQADIRLLGGKDYFCEPYMLGKATDELGKKALVSCNIPLDLVRIDLTIYKVLGHLRYRYSVCFIDVDLTYYWVKFCKEKKHAFEQLKE